MHPFDGKKSLVISTTSWLGGKNDFLGLAYLIVGAACLVLALAFAIKHKISPRCVLREAPAQRRRCPADACCSPPSQAAR